jgi:S1-C subfamily serine protease
MILDGSGTVLTNNHVVADATQITATDVNTGKRYTATLVGTNAKEDIAVIKLRDASGLTPVSIGNSGAVKVGEQVVATGNAGGRGGTPSVVTGQVTALAQTITATDSDGTNAETLSGLIQVNAPIVAGDSGGPLTDSAGKVVGIDTAASSSQAAFSGGGFSGGGGFSFGGGSSSGDSNGSADQTSAGYAIPIAHALTIAKQIESGQSDPTSNTGSTDNRGYLGVEVTDGGSVSGATISGTVQGSPAAAAGIGTGDTIVALDGHQISSASDLSQLLASSTAGQHVSVTWVTGTGASASATLTLMGADG